MPFGAFTAGILDNQLRISLFYIYSSTDMRYLGFKFCPNFNDCLGMEKNGDTIKDGDIGYPSVEARTIAIISQSLEQGESWR